ncbi:MAG: hypothetical protein WBK37_10710, partial [Kiritimatiellia bacterium]
MWKNRKKFFHCVERFGLFFSIAWKTFFHGVEKNGRVAVDFSTVWWRRQKSYFDIMRCGRGKYVVFLLDISGILIHHNSMIN